MTTDQFTEDYLTYLQGEGKVLQEYWTPKHGDWVCVGELVYLVQREPMAGLRSDVYFSLCAGGGIEEEAPFDEVTPAELVSIGDVYWLPTLWQLIQIIEGAGWRWACSFDYKAGGTEYVYWLSVTRGTSYMDEKDKDIMVAAAKPAVKAIEGRPK